MHGVPGGAEKGGTDLVRTWWIFVVLGSIMTPVALNGLSGSPGYVYTATVLEHGFTFVAAVLAILLIRRATRQQACRHATQTTIPGFAAEPTAA